MNIVLNVALCASRHAMPENVTDSIFESDLAPERITNPRMLELMANSKLSALLRAAGCTDRFVGFDEDDDYVYEFCVDNAEVHIYVTGLTVALIAALNACKAGGVGKVVLHHFDRNSNSYYEQEVY